MVGQGEISGKIATPENIFDVFFPTTGTLKKYYLEGAVYPQDYITENVPAQK